MTPDSSCAPPRATRKPEMTSSKMSSAPVSSALRPQQLQEALGRRDEAHVRRKRLGEDRRELVLLGRRDERVGVVPGHDDRARRDLGGHAGRGRDALRGQAAAGVGEQAVDVAVVGAGELQQLRAAGRRAGEADRAHRGLGARRGHAQHLDAGHAAADLLGEVDLARRRGAEARAALRRVGDRRDDLRVGVAGDERPPRAHPVDVRVLVDVEDLAARAALHEQRVAADRAHRPDGRVHAAGQDVQRAGVQLSRAPVAQRDGHRRSPYSASQFLKSSVKYRRRIFLNSVDE